MVPPHLFETATTPAQLQRLVADAKAAHMNMLRVWGGGRYLAGERWQCLQACCWARCCSPRRSVSLHCVGLCTPHSPPTASWHLTLLRPLWRSPTKRPA